MAYLRDLLDLRLLPFRLCLLAGLLCAWLLTWHDRPWVYTALAASVLLSLLGVRDRLQRRHAVLRNYPVIGHVRYLVEAIRPELRQYLFESATDGWIDYSHNHVLVKLFSHALLATPKGHEVALEKLKQDIEEQKQKSQLG